MRHRRSRFVAALAGVALAVGGCVLPLPDLDGDPAGAPSPEPGWSICTDEAAKVLGSAPKGYTIECRTVDVPENRDDPGAGTIGVALLRARATDQRDRIGSLLVNPGGPGGSGVDLALYLTRGLPAEITRRFDIVGFDPRGVGRSAPIECYTAADLDATFAYDPDPVSQESFDGLVDLTRRMVDGCGAKYDGRLSLYSTEQAARDMDDIRVALGEEKLTYLGFSYGTLLGAVYAQLFPDRIRAFVLDGAVDPQLDSVQSSEGQAMGFERAFDNFAAWCADHDRTCPIDGDARAVVTKLMDQARTDPLRNDDGRNATAGWIFWGVVSSLYSEEAWPVLGQALADLQDGDPSTVFRLADSYADRDPEGHYTNLFDANSAVNCADDDISLNVDQVRQLQSQWRDRYPMFGSSLATSLLTCVLWPADPDPYPTGAAEGAPPILVVGTKGDPATPYEQTPRLAEMLGVGRVLTWDGEGHTAYPSTRCIVREVDAYLIDLTVPDEGTVCPAR